MDRNEWNRLRAVNEMVENSRVIDSKKYMWDGIEYESGEQAGEKKAEYEKSGFETVLLEEEGRAVLYTRRVVTDVVVEGAPPL